MTQMEAFSSSPLPPAGTEQVVEGEERALASAFRAIHHWGYSYPTWGQNLGSTGGVLRGRGNWWGINSSGTVSRRGSGLGT